MIWLCITMAFTFQSTNYDFMGGLYGKVVIDYLQGIFNVVGTAFFILFFGFLLLFFFLIRPLVGLLISLIRFQPN